MKTWKARVRLKSNGRVMDIQVQARSYYDARSLVEDQYGKGSIQGGPTEV